MWTPDGPLPHAALRPPGRLRVIAPSQPLRTVSEANLSLAKAAWTSLGFAVEFGDRALAGACDPVSRAADLHEAFQDPNVGLVLSAIGGSGAAELLPHLDWALLARSPTLLCGFSDVTVLLNEIAFRAGYRTLLGPHFSSLAMKYGKELTVSSFQDAFGHVPRAVHAFPHWSDDAWYIDQETRTMHPAEDLHVVNEGRCVGTAYGGNISTLRHCLNTPWPSGGVLLLEAAWDRAGTASRWKRSLEELPAPCARAAAGVVVGRFRTGATPLDLDATLRAHFGNQIPIVTGAPFGHTTPMHTLDIGGQITLDARNERPTLRIA